jgi:hypothetical protein
MVRIRFPPAASQRRTPFGTVTFMALSFHAFVLSERGDPAGMKALTAGPGGRGRSAVRKSATPRVPMIDCSARSAYTNR